MTPTMKIEDLTKALYFLNTTEYKYSLCIQKIEDNVIYFTNNKYAYVIGLANAYDNYIKTGEIPDIFN